MFGFLIELISVPGGAVFFVMAALLVLFQIVILAIALFAEGRAFARLWATALSLAAPLCLLLAMLAGVQLSRANGLGAAAWADPSQKAMSLAQAVAGDIMLQLAGGFALVLSGRSRQPPAGAEPARGQRRGDGSPSLFHRSGPDAGPFGLIFGAGLAWRAMGFHNVFSALAMVAAEQKMQLLARGLEELPGLLIPTLLAAGLILGGLVWRIRDSRQAGKPRWSGLADACRRHPILPRHPTPRRRRLRRQPADLAAGRGIGLSARGLGQRVAVA